MQFNAVLGYQTQWTAHRMGVDADHERQYMQKFWLQSAKSALCLQSAVGQAMQMEGPRMCIIIIIIIIFVYYNCSQTSQSYSTNIRHTGRETTAATQGSAMYRRVKPAKLLPHTAHTAIESTAAAQPREHSPDGATGTHPIKLLTTQFIDPERMKGWVGLGMLVFRGFFHRQGLQSCF